MLKRKSADGQDVCPQCYIQLATHEVNAQFINGERYHEDCARKFRRLQSSSYQMSGVSKKGAQDRPRIRM